MSVNPVVIDRSKLPSDGAGFLAALYRQPFHLPLVDRYSTRSGFPRFILTRYDLVNRSATNLINVWVFEDEETNCKIIGGVGGPTRSPRADWKLFDQTLETLRQPDRYERTLELINDAVHQYVMNHPGLFVR